MNTLANTQIPQYINIQGKKLAIIPAEHYEELVQKVELYEENDFYYELSQEDLENITIGREQIKNGLFLTNDEVFEKSRKRRDEKWKR
ncbi:hypothetical protein [Capnocytophaga canis]|uniref:hypothetical protein n=1 Tax=Capnocytophaga canis TaxID=1848903 RepID=UPI001561FE22|nr:hypothetical protein [Capnocytophaga canis]